MGVLFCWAKSKMENLFLVEKFYSLKIGRFVLLGKIKNYLLLKNSTFIEKLL
jgi:hypothetical protein